MSTQVGGPSETIKDGETGYLVPAEDVNAFAARTLELLRDPAKQQAMGHAARQHVEATLSAARYADQMEALFDKLIK